MECGPAAAAWTELSLLAGRPGGAGWVDGPGSAAHFLGPWGAAFDGADRLYLLDDQLLRIYDIPSDMVRTIAGRLGVGYDDGIGADASFFQPTDVLIVGDTLLLSDTENHLLREIEVDTWKVTTVAGQPRIRGREDGVGMAATFGEPEGLAWDESSGQVYIVDTDNHTIRRMDLESREVTTVAGSPKESGTDDGVGTKARFRRPTAMTMDEDARALYICDAGNVMVRKLTLDDLVVSTVATLNNEARAIAMHGSDVVVAVGPELVEISTTTGEITSVAGTQAATGFVDGIGSDARFAIPEGFAPDGNGGLFITDRGNHAVRRIELDSREVTTVIGANSSGAADGKGEDARFSGPQGLVGAPGGLVYVADTENHAIRKVDIATGKVTTFAGTLGEPGDEDGEGTDARFNRPSGLALDGDSTLYIAELGSGALRKLDLSSGAVSTLAFSKGSVMLEAPQKLAFDQGHLYVTEAARILDVNLAEEEISLVAEDTGASALFASLAGVAADGRGNLLVADALKNTVLQVAIDTGEVTTFVGTAGFGTDRLYYPKHLALRADGTLFVADYRTVRVVAMDGSQMITIVGNVDGWGVEPGPLPAQLGESTAMALTDEGTLVLAAENALLMVR